MTALVGPERVIIERWETGVPEVLTYLRAHAAGDGRLPDFLIERLLIAGVIALSNVGRVVPRPLPSKPERGWTPQGDAAMIPAGGVTIPPLDDQGVALDEVVQHVEEVLIDQALTRTKGNRQAAARLLGLKRTTLVAKLRRRFPDADLED